ncbi:MAG: hypothetical protein IKL10_10640 [Clostridia bacterium]|nr:hypothetical protein [Clostridia bacterium]
MKSLLSKSLSVILCVVLLLSSVAVLSVSAAEEECNCGHCPSIVIPGIFQSKVRYLDENGNEMLNASGEPYAAPFFMKSTPEIVLSALEKALLPLAGLLVTQTDINAACANAIAEVLGDALLSNIALDEYGHVIKNIQADKYTTSLANLPAEQREYALDQIPLQKYAEIAGMDHLYFFSYFSTGNMIDTIEELYELIQIAKEETGHDKVNLVPISQGGSLENALMQYYIDNELDFAADVNRVCYVVPAADGAAVLGDIFRYGLLDDPEALYGYMFPSLLDEDQGYLAYLINLILRIFPNADLNNILDTAVNVLVEDYLEYSTLLWALVPSGDYLACREMYLSDPEDVYVREQTDWYYNAQVNSRKNILDLKEKGVEFFDIVDYNYTMYQICDSWDKVNSDGIIHTDSESFGATSIGVDVSLPDDYVQANTYCTDPSHNHIDEGRLVDATTGILCESTFYFKGQDHEKTARNDVIMRLAVRILTDETFENVYSDPAFPQFNYARDSRGAVNDYNEWKNYDTSALPAELAAEFKAALSELEAAVNSTYMPTAEFNAVKDKFDAVTYKVVNGTDKPEEGTNFFLNLLTKIFKFFSDLMLKFFGGKGYSDIILFR